LIKKQLYSQACERFIGLGPDDCVFEFHQGMGSLCVHGSDSFTT